jgi:hypothetical protein
MTTKRIIGAAAIAATAVLVSASVAQANPATSMQAIESSAAQLCGAITNDPTDQGVLAGMDGLHTRGLDEMDGAMVLITAIHHVCPQHQGLLMGVMEPLTADEVCGEPNTFS